jgi:hypothetical protein
MESVKYILELPDLIEGIGEVYPVTMNYYDEFMNVANIICLSYDHFNLDEISQTFDVEKDEIKLLDLIKLALSETLEGRQSFILLERIFSIVLRTEVKLDLETGSFIIDEHRSITSFNYDQLREVIMAQNLLFQPKVYKNKTIQAWADKVLKARAKNSIDSSIEDMITTVSVVGKKSYKEIRDYTIYQLRASFNRILKYENYKESVIYRSSMGGGDIPVLHFAEKIDMFKSPYDDLFKEESSFKNINAAMSDGK